MPLHSTRHQRVSEYVLLVLWLTAATAFVTWPHARVFASHVVSHIDPLFSMWRLAWFSHAIANGEHLLHANIFHPEPFTYLLSDATFLQAALAAPALWSGVPLPIVYNALLALGIISSGMAIYWLATGLGVSRPASMLAATIFALAPYRIEHINHLELQWPTFAILTLGSLYRVLYAPHWTHGVLLGLFMSLQLLASVYYAVYMLPIVAALVAVSLPTVPHAGRTLRVAGLAVALCAALSLPIAQLYVAQSQRTGGRGQSDIAMYSATPRSYLASPEENTLYGFTADRFGGGEKRLFPGTIAVVLGAIGLFSARRRTVIAALVVLLLSIDLSFGVHGLLYPVLLELVPALHGLRAAARYGVFVLAAVAVLAALGWEVLDRRARRVALSTGIIGPALLTLVCAEYWSPQHRLVRVDMDPPVYKFLSQLPEGVVLELPLPERPGDAGLEADYEFWSAKHWHKLVNGYSGYLPHWYGPMLDRLRSLPDAASLALLRERNVRYILVHQQFLRPGESERFVTALLACPELRPLGTFRDWAGATAIFELTH